MPRAWDRELEPCLDAEKMPRRVRAGARTVTTTPSVWHHTRQHRCRLVTFSADLGSLFAEEFAIRERTIVSGGNIETLSRVKFSARHDVVAIRNFMTGIGRRT